jgi:hypothetical protein
MKTMESLKKGGLDTILGIRSQLGADLKKVFLVTRVWSGSQIGEGDVEETLQEISPSPGIKDYSHNIRMVEGGNIKQGDLIIHQISKNKFETEKEIDCSSDDPAIEKLFRVGEDYYRVISVVERQLTWDVQVRRLSDQTRRGA